MFSVFVYVFLLVLFSPLWSGQSLVGKRWCQAFTWTNQKSQKASVARETYCQSNSSNHLWILLMEQTLVVSKIIPYEIYQTFSQLTLTNWDIGQSWSCHHWQDYCCTMVIFTIAHRIVGLFIYCFFVAIVEGTIACRSNNSHSKSMFYFGHSQS